MGNWHLIQLLSRYLSNNLKNKKVKWKLRQYFQNYKRSVFFYHFYDENNGELTFDTMIKWKSIKQFPSILRMRCEIEIRL